MSVSDILFSRTITRRQFWENLNLLAALRGFPSLCLQLNDGRLTPSNAFTWFQLEAHLQLNNDPLHFFEDRTGHFCILLDAFKPDPAGFQKFASFVTDHISNGSKAFVSLTNGRPVRSFRQFHWKTRRQRCVPAARRFLDSDDGGSDDDYSDDSGGGGRDDGGGGGGGAGRCDGLRITRDHVYLLRVPQLNHTSAATQFALRRLGFSEYVRSTYFEEKDDRWNLRDDVDSTWASTWLDSGYSVEMFLWDLITDIWTPLSADRSALAVQSASARGARRYEHFGALDNEIVTQMWADYAGWVVTTSSVAETVLGKVTDLQLSMDIAAHGIGAVSHVVDTAVGKVPLTAHDQVSFWRTIFGMMPVFEVAHRRTVVRTVAQMNERHDTLALELTGPDCVYCGKQLPRRDDAVVFGKNVQRCHTGIVPNNYGVPAKQWWNIFAGCAKCNQIHPHQAKRLESHGADPAGWHIAALFISAGQRELVAAAELPTAAAVQAGATRFANHARKVMNHLCDILQHAGVTVSLPPLESESRAYILLNFVLGFYCLPDDPVAARALPRWAPFVDAEVPVE